jgi:peptidoglycan/LPS O-acetylase OafA/YrhL
MTTAASAATRWRLGYQPALDGLRGIAILMVVVYHARFAAHEFHWFGSNGVAVFFTLSGFLITRLLIEEREALGGISLSRFYARRALRLLPAFAVMVLVTALVGLADLSEVLRASSYLANWWLAAGDLLGPLSHTWSLSIEEQFYLVWPLLLVVPFAIGPRVVAPVALAVTLGYRLLGPEVPETEYAFATHMQIPMVLMGVCLGVAWKGAMRTPRWAALLGAGLIVAASLIAPGQPGTRLASPLASLGAVLLIVEVLGGGQPARVLASGPLVSLGLVSYSLYLWHYPVMFALGVLPHDPAGGIDPVSSLMSLALSLLLAVLSWRLIEQPILALRRRLNRSHQPYAAAQGVTPG